jgi:hypothetical protein
MHIAPIETRYKGYRFRSRLEARWAVFFDALKIQWEYEKQGFHLPSGDYLPDFWLPQVSMWAEVKAEPMTGIESRLCCELAAATGWPCLKLIGVPENKGYWAVYPLQEGYDESLHGPFDVEFCLTNYHGYVTGEGRFYSSPGSEEDSRHDDTELAVFAARSARFEHGETPVL